MSDTLYMNDNSVNTFDKWQNLLKYQFFQKTKVLADDIKIESSAKHERNYFTKKFWKKMFCWKEIATPTVFC